LKFFKPFFQQIQFHSKRLGSQMFVVQNGQTEEANQKGRGLYNDYIQGPIL